MSYDTHISHLLGKKKPNKNSKHNIYHSGAVFIKTNSNPQMKVFSCLFITTDA